MQTFDLTIKEKENGVIMGKLLQLARALSERRPDLMVDTTPLGITLGLVGIGGSFTLPAETTKLLLVAGGIGVTPFLSMLNSITAADRNEPWDIILVISMREAHLATDLVHASLGPFSAAVSLTVHIFAPQASPSSEPNIVTHTGRLVPSFFQTIDDVKARTILVCGPVPYEEMVIEGLQSAGANREAISRENFAY